MVLSPTATKTDENHTIDTSQKSTARKTYSIPKYLRLFRGSSDGEES